MDRLKTYDLVNSCESLLGLSNIIKSLADEDGKIQGKTRKFDAEKMALSAENYSNVPKNTLTREFGIRQQAIYLIYIDRTIFK
ncbi:MAG: hypothetical protein ACJAVA_000247 [Flavobacteriaceae bacterium]|jgi:hypothetical protein